MVTRAVETAQRQVEELNFERRKNVLKYDDVMNTQRQVIYAERQKILRPDLREAVLRRGSGGHSGGAMPPDVFPEEWDLDGLVALTRSTRRSAVAG
jgi:preprotein translocase subunit SecA